MSGLGIVPKETCSRLFNQVCLIIFLTKLLEMDVWARHGAEGDLISHIQHISFEDIRLIPGDLVTVATDMYGKSPSRGSGYMRLRENIHL